MVHTGFVERVLAQNKKRFREKRSIQLHVAVNLCRMNFLQMNFQNKIWLKVKIPGSYYRGFSVYSATTLANFFLPRLIMSPSPLKSLRVYFVEISVTFSSATETPPCWIFLRSMEIPRVMWFIRMAVLLLIILLRHGERCIISLGF